MQVSVVIVSYKVPYHLYLCLSSLQLALKDISSEIIVVDNDSRDQTNSLIQANFPDVNFIQNKTNDGFSKANNLAIKMAKGQYICLINPDTVVGSNAIKDSLSKHQSINKCGILGVRLIDGTGHFLPESKINKLNLKTATLKLIGFSKSYYNHSLGEEEEGKTATLVGAFMCFKAEDYKKVEGLDENYFMYGEDIDLSYQFLKAGFQNYYLGHQSILHFKGESTLKDKIYFQRFFDSVKLYFKKHYTNSKIMIGIASLFFVIAKHFKKNQMLKIDKKQITFHNIFCIGKNEHFSSLVMKHYEQEITNLTYKEALGLDFSHSMIVFNTDVLNYDDIINLMILNRNKNNFFRLKVPGQAVLIGSDSSTSQGKVLFLN